MVAMASPDVKNTARPLRGGKRSHAGLDERTLGVLPLDPAGMMSPAGQVAGQAIEGSFKDPVKIRELASRADVLTADIEHVECSELEALEKEGVEIQPSPACIRTIQDKLVQKKHLE